MSIRNYIGMGCLTAAAAVLLFGNPKKSPESSVDREVPKVQHMTAEELNNTYVSQSVFDKTVKDFEKAYGKAITKAEKLGLKVADITGKEKSNPSLWALGVETGVNIYNIHQKARKNKTISDRGIDTDIRKYNKESDGVNTHNKSIGIESDIYSQRASDLSDLLTNADIELDEFTQNPTEKERRDVVAYTAKLNAYGK